MLVAILSESIGPVDLLTVAVQTLPGRFPHHDCVTDFDLILNVVHHWAVAGFTRQVQMTRTQFDLIPMTGVAGFVAAIAHRELGQIDQSITTVPGNSIPAVRSNQLDGGDESDQGTYQNKP